MKTEAEKRANRAYYQRHRAAICLQQKCRDGGVRVELAVCRRITAAEAAKQKKVRA